MTISTAFFVDDTGKKNVKKKLHEISPIYYEVKKNDNQ